MEVMEGLETAWRITSVATKPVDPATIIFMVFSVFFWENNRGMEVVAQCYLGVVVRSHSTSPYLAKCLQYSLSTMLRGLSEVAHVLNVGFNVRL